MLEVILLSCDKKTIKHKRKKKKRKEKRGRCRLRVNAKTLTSREETNRLRAAAQMCSSTVHILSHTHTPSFSPTSR